MVFSEKYISGLQGGWEIMDVNQVLKSFFKEYMVKRNAQTSVAFLDDKVHIMGVDGEEKATNLSEAKKWIELEIENDRNPYSLKFVKTDEMSIGRTCTQGFGRITVGRALDGDKDSEYTLIYSAIVKENSKKEAKIMSLHLSTDVQAGGKESLINHDFLSKISHELRTPMNAITGMVCIAKNLINDKERVKECLDKIDASTRYITDFVGDFLDVSRLSSGNVTLNEETFDLDNLVRELEVLMRPSFEAKKLRYIMVGKFRDSVLIGDDNRLYQILSNLLSNAVKFTDNGGMINFTIEQLVQDDSKAMLKFSVRDNGRGIPKDKCGKIFDIFENDAPDDVTQSERVGLGLAISNYLVELMGSKLEVISEEGKGSEFYFTIELPIGERENVVRKDRTAAKKQKRFNFTGKRIMLVEDNDLNQEIAKTVLELVGCRVDVVNNGQEAVDLFESKPAFYYKAILMDIRMPVMDGLQATKIIRNSSKKDAKKIPIVATTANAFDEDVKKSMESGMNGHLVKPLEIEQLYQTLSELVG